MNLDQLRTFRAVVELGSFSRAAQKLRIGQSTVSFQIKALESDLGARLIDRAGRVVRLTASGKMLLRYARRLLALHDEAVARLRAEEEGGTGRVVIAASTIPAEYLLPSVLEGYRAEHPDVSVVVDVSDSRRAAASLLAQECDLAVVGSPVRDPRAVSSRFAHDEVILAGPSRGPHGAVRDLSRKQLAGLPLILREPGSGTRDSVARLIPVERAAADAPGNLQVGSTEAARRCVLRGLGFSFISRCAVEDDVAAGRIRVVGFPGTPVRRGFWVARLKSVTLSAAARAFLDSLAC